MVEYHKEFSHLLTNPIEEEFLENKSLAILPEGNELPAKRVFSGKGNT